MSSNKCQPLMLVRPRRKKTAGPEVRNRRNIDTDGFRPAGFSLIPNP